MDEAAPTVTRPQRAPLQAPVARQAVSACQVRRCSRNVAYSRTKSRLTLTWAVTCTPWDSPCYSDSCSTCRDWGRSVACARYLSCRSVGLNIYQIVRKKRCVIEWLSLLCVKLLFLTCPFHPIMPYSGCPAIPSFLLNFCLSFFAQSYFSRFFFKMSLLFFAFLCF